MSVNLCRASRHRSPVRAPVLSSFRRPRLPVPFRLPVPPGVARPAVPVERARLVAAQVERVQPVVAQVVQVVRARLVVVQLVVVPVVRARAVQEPAVVYLSQAARPSQAAHPSQVAHPQAEGHRSERAHPAPWADPRPESWTPQARRFPAVPVTAERRSPTRQRMQDKAGSQVEAAHPAVAHPAAAKVPVPVHPTVVSFIRRLRTSARPARRRVRWWTPRLLSRPQVRERFRRPQLSMAPRRHQPQQLPR